MDKLSLKIFIVFCLHLGISHIASSQTYLSDTLWEDSTHKRSLLRRGAAPGILTAAGLGILALEDVHG